MNWETKDTPDGFIGADVPANLVAHYFVIFIQSRSIYVGMANLKHNLIAVLIHILANVFYRLHRTAELNINMRIESFDDPNGPLASCWHCSRTHTQIDQFVVLTDDEKRYADNVFVYML